LLTLPLCKLTVRILKTRLLAGFFSPEFNDKRTGRQRKSERNSSASMQKVQKSTAVSCFSFHRPPHQPFAQFVSARLRKH
ncbi:hypothetical protein, partial [Mixta calida]|uniref:hypothetical protein n=1 Tax=Mixta calida TaxID=665913 RepID=UPI0028AE7C08